MFVWNVLCNDVWFAFVVVFVLRSMFVSGVCGRMRDAVWCVVLFCVIVVCLCVFFHVSEGVVRDLLCGDVWFGFVCVVLVCVCSLFSNMCGL